MRDERGGRRLRSWRWLSGKDSPAGTNPPVSLNESGSRWLAVDRSGDRWVDPVGGDERGARLGPGAVPILGTAVTQGMDESQRSVIDRRDLIGGAHGGKAGQVGPVDDTAEN